MTTGWTQTDYCLTPEQEEEMDAAYREQEEHDWLASWADDFHSDEWLEAALAKAITPDSSTIGG